MSHDRPSREAHRRGALLLLVLGMLALFLLVGMLMLVNASRARTTARAFAAATAAVAGNDAGATRQLDEALMVLLRGSRNPLPAWITESLLEDKYGATTLTGTIVFTPGTAAGTAPILSGLITSPLTSGTPASRLNGRILTLVPPAGAGDTVSFRILGATGGSGSTTVYLANAPFRPWLSLPSGTGAIRINGREFTPPSGTTTPPPQSPEPYDAYDDSNAWLAQPTVTAGTVSFNRLSYPNPPGLSGTAAAAAAEVDNDGDGVLDGQWISGILGDRPSPTGGTLRYRVSYLVLDLDGRLSINATGLANLVTGTMYTGTTPATSAPAQAPLGMGYGPADLDASVVISGSLPAADGLPAFISGTNTPAPRLWPSLLRGGTPEPASLVATDAQRRAPPRVGAVSGRYGTGTAAVPGSAGDDTLGNQQTSFARYAYLVGGTTWSGSTAIAPNGTSSATFSIAGPVGNSVTDLKGQLKAFVSSTGNGQVTPTLNFFAPDPAAVDYQDDPYESRFDTAAPRHTAPRNASTPRNDDNPFTLADLERLLRPFDADASTLPPRLAALLDDRTQALRMAITTDSWDAPVLTGSAARMVEDQIAAIVGSGTQALAYPWVSTNAFSPDVAAGLKFDVNRLVANPAQTQDYCRGLYTLAVLLTGSTSSDPSVQKRMAQWAVNVLDFRDEDSTMTRFVYDRDLSDGWNLATTGTVFGVERPDLLITETAGWWSATSGSGQLFVNLHRPAWNALVTGTSGPLASRERLARALESTGTAGGLDLAKVSGSNSRVWQVRFDSDKVLQLRSDLTTTGTVETLTQSLLQGGTIQTGSVTVLGSAIPSGTLALAPGGYVCVHSPEPQNFTVSGSVTPHPVNSGSGQFVRAATGTVSLERLADPTQPNGPTNPYVVVDSAPVNVIPVPPVSPPPDSFKKQRRRGTKDPDGSGHPLATFWRGKPPSAWVADGSSLDTYPLGMIGSGTLSDPVPWLHWPNRPFVSHAELALVPADAAEDFLPNYSFPTSSLASGTTAVSGSAGLGQLLLDAVHVPSRFAENAISITAGPPTGTIPDDVGFFRPPDQPGAVIGLPTWREPGRINVNTIVSGTGTTLDADSLTWATLIGGTQTTLSGTTVKLNPFATSGTASPTPARSIAQMLSLSGTTGQPIACETFSSGTALHPRDKNPFFAYAKAIRLANTATVRSNVFAVWITLEIRDDSPTGPSTTYRRLFAIIDRSIPVGFSPGEDLNVRDTIRMLRYLD